MSVAVAERSETLGPEIFRLAVEVCPSGMVIVGADGAILTVNAEIERLFGYSRDELFGRPIEILLPEHARGKHVAQRAGFARVPSARYLGTGRDFSGRRKDGSEFPIEVGLNPVRVGGELMVISAIVDISERKHLERMQDEFVSTVSHELRTPLTSITASLGLLLAGSTDRLPKPAAHLLEIAQANCQRLVRMVNDILDLKKLDAGQMPFNFQRCEARALLEKAIEANQGLAESCSVAVRLGAARSDAVLYVDPDRFIQVVTNLLANALKFSPAGSEVTVVLAKHGESVRIGVRDHGAGVPAEFRSRIFESFAQADETGGKKGGSGLGLSIARRLVAGMHGQIGFEDAEGGGTLFYVDLPNADHLARWQGAAATG
ncbi:MAG: PAS domain-containing sensor histidine kinase [Pseudolabrys sp.]